MVDPKDTTSFFRKVVKFVANPSTEWSDLGTQSDEARENEFAKGELKAMIERKRRNDFVRKREFDMLRKVRREGLTSEQLAALGGSSRLDDSEARSLDSQVKADGGVKAKIDEIEQQMVGEQPYLQSGRRALPSRHDATVPAAMDMSARGRPPPTTQTPRLEKGGPRPAAAQAASASASQSDAEAVDTLPSAAGFDPLSAPSRSGLASLNPVSGEGGESPLGFTQPFVADAADAVHDPELDEVVIAFANADFDECERGLLEMTRSGASRAHHAETWLVLFDLYRAIGQHHKFETLAVDYAEQFGLSAPQWFSLPKLVTESARSEERPRAATGNDLIGWTSPEYVDADVVAALSSLALQMPLPWVFDWRAIRQIDAEACLRLSDLFRNWATQPLDMRWVGGEDLLSVLHECAPTGARDVDPAFWQVRLDALRLANRPDRFDEAAMDYCVTYEVSPPSWEPARCKVRIRGGGQSATSIASTLISDVSTSFVESQLPDSALVQVGSVELAGQLVGDISATLRKMDAELGGAGIVNVSCARLIRVDFIAAGDLLNWVLARRSENRSVSFIQTHRMVALFFGAMGINEHARVKVGTV